MEALELDADHLPPSCRHVAHALQEADRPLTAKEIAKITGNPRGTVKEALRRLIDENEVEKRPNITDQRAHLYQRA